MQHDVRGHAVGLGPIAAPRLQRVEQLVVGRAERRRVRGASNGRGDRRCSTRSPYGITSTGPPSWAAITAACGPQLDDGAGRSGVGQLQSDFGDEPARAALGSAAPRARTRRPVAVAAPAVELVEEPRRVPRLGDEVHGGVGARERDVEDAPLLLDVVGEVVRHQPVVDAEHDDVRPLHALHPVHGRERDLVGASRRPAGGRDACAATARSRPGRARAPRPRDQRVEIVAVARLRPAPAAVEGLERAAEPDRRRGRAAAASRCRHRARTAPPSMLEVVEELVEPAGARRRRGRATRCVASACGPRCAAGARGAASGSGGGPRVARSGPGSASAPTRRREPQVRERGARARCGRAPRSRSARSRGSPPRAHSNCTPRSTRAHAGQHRDRRRAAAPRRSTPATCASGRAGQLLGRMALGRDAPDRPRASRRGSSSGTRTRLYPSRFVAARDDRRPGSGSSPRAAGARRRGSTGRSR